MIPLTAKGKYLVIEFFDHVQGRRELVECRVVGEIVEVSPKKIVVRCWDVKGDDEFRLSNEETFTLIQSTVIGYTELKAKKYIRA